MQIFYSKVANPIQRRNCSTKNYFQGNQLIKSQNYATELNDKIEPWADKGGSVRWECLILYIKISKEWLSRKYIIQLKYLLEAFQVSDLSSPLPVPIPTSHEILQTLRTCYDEKNILPNKTKFWFNSRNHIENMQRVSSPLPLLLHPYQCIRSPHKKTNHATSWTQHLLQSIT